MTYELITTNKILAPYTTDDNHFANLVEAFSKFQYLVIPKNKHLKMTEDDIKDWVVKHVKFDNQGEKK